MRLAPDATVTIVTLILTSVASASGALNMMFLRSVLSDVRGLRKDRHRHAQFIQAHQTDIEWIKRELRLEREGPSEPPRLFPSDADNDS